MKIKIREDALELYIQDNTDYSGYYFGEDRWEQIYEKIAGKTLEVDTEELFKHEFNTKPIPGISEDGLRIFEEFVEEIYDDIRAGKARCELCSHTSDTLDVCSHCGKSGYLEELIEDEEYYY